MKTFFAVLLGILAAAFLIVGGCAVMVGGCMNRVENIKTQRNNLHNATNQEVVSSSPALRFL